MSDTATSHPSTVRDRSPAIEISVVVSTCNRAHKLPGLFAALRAQSVNGVVPWELIVVDNRSSDDTTVAIGRLATGCAFPVIAAFEGRQGRSHGLNKGITLARGSIIAFADDDGVPAPDWLDCIRNRFDAQAGLACVGGRVELYDPADAPITIRLSRDSAVLDLTTFSATNSPIIGCNMAVRASAIRVAGPFDAELGAGTRVPAYEDVDMLYRLMTAGAQVHYDPAIVVQHDHGRREPAQIHSLFESYSIGRGGFYGKYLIRADARVAKWVYWDLRRLAADWIRSGLVTARARAALRQMALMLIGASRYWRVKAAPAAPTARSRWGPAQ